MWTNLLYVKLGSTVTRISKEQQVQWGTPCPQHSRQLGQITLLSSAVSTMKEVVWFTHLYDTLQGLHKKAIGMLDDCSTLCIRHSETTVAVDSWTDLLHLQKLKRSILHSYSEVVCNRRVWSTHYNLWKESKMALLEDLFRKVSRDKAWMLVIQVGALGWGFASVHSWCKSRVGLQVESGSVCELWQFEWDRRNLHRSPFILGSIFRNIFFLALQVQNKSMQASKSDKYSATWNVHKHDKLLVWTHSRNATHVQWMAARKNCWKKPKLSLVSFILNWMSYFLQSLIAPFVWSWEVFSEKVI